MEVIRQHLEVKPKAMHGRDSGVVVSPRLERITMRALNKEVKRRYATAKEMGRALSYLQPAARRPEGAQTPPASRVVTQGPKPGHRISLSSQRLALGRIELGSSNEMISRHHASVFYKDGSYWLEDLSKNGTWVDNRRVYGEVPLRRHSIVVIGDVVLRLEQASS